MIALSYQRSYVPQKEDIGERIPMKIDEITRYNDDNGGHADFLIDFRARLSST